MTRQFSVALFAASLILQHVFCSVPEVVPQETRFNCLVVKGQKLCCPYKDSHFCKGQLSCCPSGTTCNEEQTACEQRNALPFLTRKTESPVALIQNPEIPITYGTGPLNCAPMVSGGPLNRGSRTFQCPKNTTYCEDAYRFGFTCCPLQNATCCGDYYHCCPEGTQCDLSKGLCLTGPNSGTTATNSGKSWSRVFRATTPSKLKPLNVDGHLSPVEYPKFGPKSCQGPFGRECPDNSSCPDSATCCSFGDDTYGCCPMSNAVCCSDHLHCCPKGTTCNVSQGTCESRPSSKTLLDDGKEMDQIVCPGGKYVCPDATTCCAIGSGLYACCPFPNAVCCSDKVHCCPHATTCNLSKGTCERRNLVMEEVVVVRKAKQFGDIICPGGKYVCPDRTTCCDMGGGNYGCCPMPNAVCCSDKIHCCPYGTKCSLSTDSCIMSAGISTRLFKKQPACRVTPRRPY